MRSTNRICSALILNVLLASIALQASAETVFRDDFGDGSVTNDVPVDRDGNPVIWNERPAEDGYDATSGDYVFTPTTSVQFMGSDVLDITLTDVSIRTQVRSSSVDGGVFVLARNVPSVGGYFAGIDYSSTRGGTNLILGRTDGGNNTFFGSFPVLPFDVRTEDAVLQLDVIDNELKLWGWKAGDPMPDQPQVTHRDSTYSEGMVRIVNETRNNNIATFRYVHVADSHIFLPAVGLAGDLNNDSSVDAADAGILFSNWGTVPPGDPIADFNHDGFVDAADAEEMFVHWTGDSGNLVSVPEPASQVLAIAAMMLVLFKNPASFSTNP